MTTKQATGGKCGCVSCREGFINNPDRNYWKSKRNKRGHAFGQHQKGGKQRR